MEALRGNSIYDAVVCMATGVDCAFVVDSSPKKEKNGLRGFMRTAAPKMVAAVAAIIALLAFVPAAAQNNAPLCKDSAAVEVFFPVKQTQIDLGYNGNGARLEAFIARLKALSNDKTQKIARINISGYTSPDGSSDLNKQLANARAASMAEYLRSRVNIADSLISIRYAGVDWHGLYRAVEASALPGKAQVLDIILHEPEYTYGANGKDWTRSRKQQLMNLNGGRTWAWMMKNIYPQLRSSASIAYYIEEAAQNDGVGDKSAGEEVKDTIPHTAEKLDDTSSASDAQPILPPANQTFARHTVFALRSNLLLPLLNVGVEVPVGNRLSIGADYYYPWLFRNSSHKNCFQLAFVSGEARCWLGHRSKARRLLGHSVAAYGAWGYYDFEHNWSGHQGDFTSFGLDYVFAKPVFKGKMHLELQLAVGYIHTKAQPYDVFYDGGNLIRRKDVYKNIDYVGPTKAAVSLVLPLKVRKGGCR